MILKVIRHITVSIILAVVSALLLFKFTISSGVIIGWTMSIAGMLIGLGLYIKSGINIFTHQLIMIAGTLLSYYLFHYMVYIELETKVPSTILESDSIKKGWTYLYHSNLEDLRSFWPIFKSKLVFKDLLFLLLGLEGHFYIRYKYNAFDSTPYDTEESQNDSLTGTSISNKRKVKSRRFNRRF